MQFLSGQSAIEGVVSVQEQFAEVSARDALAGSFALSPALADFVPKDIARPRFHAASKRLLDLLIAVPTLILTAPLLLAVALLIRLDSAGPIVFRQTRLGLGGRPFGILKFRTMNVVEDGEHVVQAARNDARITRAGAFLRAASLDELPQLLNVIKGEMSLVGPRPHATAHDALYATLIPGYELRQSVKPGITGWAQVNGLRGETDTLDKMVKRVEHDLEYIQRWSVWLDLKILVLTIFGRKVRQNAY
jgi:putative colanic acid biosynthesis UDP-glucose lipid carrier transferase